MRCTSIGFFLLASGLLSQLALYNYHWVVRCGWQLQNSTKILFIADPQIEGDRKVQREGLQGEIDLLFNDFYLRHIYQTALRLSAPRHVILLGDLFSSEHIDLEEYLRRVARFNFIFEADPTRPVHRINLTGNHDIGYGAMMEKSHVIRFEEAFGPVNALYEIGGHRFVVINSMNVDPADDLDLASQTQDFISDVAEAQKKDPKELILLTHIPLHKPRGVCYDEPLIIANRKGIVSKQNFLSPESSQRLLRELKPRFIFSGHDHEGCLFEHDGGVVEYTVRSVMAEYSGNSAFFEIAHNGASYEYAFSNCIFLDHIKVKVVLIASLVFQIFGLLFLLCGFCCCSGSSEGKVKAV